MAWTATFARTSGNDKTGTATAFLDGVPVYSRAIEMSAEDEAAFVAEAKAVRLKQTADSGVETQVADSLTAALNK